MGYAHRDLKPENLIFDKNYDIKIVDFGFTCPIEGRDGSGLASTTLGTHGFMAPEIYYKKAYKAQEVDLFACGVILFMMMTQRNPFGMATTED